MGEARKASGLKAKEQRERQREKEAMAQGQEAKKGGFFGGKKREKKKEEKPKNEEEGDSLVIRVKSKLVGKGRQMFYPEYRHAQLARFKWGGPQSDALIYVP